MAEAVISACPVTALMTFALLLNLSTVLYWVDGRIPSDHLTSFGTMWIPMKTCYHFTAFLNSLFQSVPQLLVSWNQAHLLFWFTCLSEELSSHHQPPSPDCPLSGTTCFAIHPFSSAYPWGCSSLSQGERQSNPPANQTPPLTQTWTPPRITPFLVLWQHFHSNVDLE